MYTIEFAEEYVAHFKGAKQVEARRAEMQNCFSDPSNPPKGFPSKHLIWNHGDVLDKLQNWQQQYNGQGDGVDVGDTVLDFPLLFSRFTVPGKIFPKWQQEQWLKCLLKINFESESARKWMNFEDFQNWPTHDDSSGN